MQTWCKKHHLRSQQTVTPPESAAGGCAENWRASDVTDCASQHRRPRGAHDVTGVALHGAGGVAGR